MPKQRVEAEEKKSRPKGSKLSYFLNLCFEVYLGFQFFLLISMIVLMPVAFVCIAIIGIPIVWSDLSNAYNSVLSSIGWNGVAEAILIPLGFFLGLLLD